MPSKLKNQFGRPESGGVRQPGKAGGWLDVGDQAPQAVCDPLDNVNSSFRSGGGVGVGSYDANPQRGQLLVKGFELPRGVSQDKFWFEELVGSKDQERTEWVGLAL